MIYSLVANRNDIDLSKEVDVRFSVYLDDESRYITITINHEGIICDGWDNSDETGSAGTRAHTFEELWKLMVGPPQDEIEEIVSLLENEDMEDEPVHEMILDIASAAGTDALNSGAGQQARYLINILGFIQTKNDLEAIINRE